MVLAYVIELPPITKKNSQRILVNRRTGKPFVAPSAQYKTYESKAMKYLAMKPKTPINGSVNVKCLFYMPTRRRVDLVNLQEAVLDILVRAGVIEDDHSGIVASMDGSRVLYDKAAPRTEIYIEKKQEEQRNGDCMEDWI